MPVRHVVAQGECMVSIARQYGFDDWSALFDHPDNAGLKKRRPNPSTLYPGDVVVIPDRKEKKVDCALKKKHSFTVRRQRCVLRVIVKGGDQKPLARKKYLLCIKDQELRGETGGDGLIEQPVRFDDKTGELTVWLESEEDGPRFRWDLRIGELDPIEEGSGVIARLNNLGFYCAENDDPASPRARAALKGFQIDAGLDATGDLDDATRDKLREQHGEA